MQPSAPQHGKGELRRQIYQECRAMAEYALAKGKPFPASAIQTIEAFEAVELAAGEETEAKPAPQGTDLDIAELVAAHDLLARLIEPVTPQVVLLLDKEHYSHTLLKFLGPISLVRQLMLAAILSLVVFIGMIATPYIDASSMAEDVLSATDIEQFARLVFYMGAAGLGASFAALYKANNYISQGTYDPCHESSYWIRFSLGIIAGLLLAVLISQKAIQNNEMLSPGIMRPLLAILGGFSADLVYTFLNRMVETFKSLFSGSTQDIINAKSEEAKTKLATLETEGRMNLAKDLMQMQQKLATETDPEQIKQQLNAVLQNLMQSKQ